MANLRFEPFTTIVSTSFWTVLAKRKLVEWRLDEQEIPIFGYYYPGTSQLSSRLHITEESWDDCLGWSSSLTRVKLPGKLKVFNTIESFKGLDKQRILKNIQQDALRSFSNGNFDDFKRAMEFKMFVFVDLKKHHFYYHCLYPAVFCADPIVVTKVERSIGREIFKPTHEFAKKNSIGQFFLKDAIDLNELLLEDYLILIDPSSHEENILGWPLRNGLLWFAHQHCNAAYIIRHNINDSFLINFGGKFDPESLQVTGWEKNESGSGVGPRFVDLSPIMDPRHLAKDASNLNLKLIKWRLLPSINLDSFTNCKALLFGAGTLGCNVTRLLLGWGVDKITLVDNGKVSFSNPPRQSLFRFEDCLGGGASKAPCAANRALEIDPSAKIEGVGLHIPMPGHRLQDKEVVKKNLLQIWQLIKDNDIIFLLTDSRESRWVPSLLGAIEDKLVITVALGFDSFVAMRHGMTGQAPRLSCYFCNDIHAPGDTLSNRTIDQQCTVSRPGISFSASSAAVELVASILQHPLGPLAPVTQTSSPIEPLPKDASCLGCVPHQIRGFQGHFQNMLLVGEAFENCTACSPQIINAIKDEGVELLLKLLEDPKLVAEISGSAKIGIDLDSIQPLDVDSDDQDFTLV